MDSKLKLLFDIQRFQYSEKLKNEGVRQLIISAPEGFHFVFVDTDDAMEFYKFDGDSMEVIEKKTINPEAAKCIDHMLELQGNENFFQLDGVSILVWQPHCEPEYIKINKNNNLISEQLKEIFKLAVTDIPQW